MAVTAVNEEFDKRSGSRQGGVKNYVRSFQITCSDKADGPATATGSGAAGLGLPVYGSIHDEDTDCWLNSMSVTVKAGSTVWTAVCGYTNDAGDSIDEENNDNTPADPDSDPAIVLDRDSYEIDEVMEKDAADTPVLNSAGDPFDPPLMRLITINVTRVQFSGTTVPPWWSSLANKVNDADITIVGGEEVEAGYAIIKLPKSSTTLYRSGVSYSQFTYEIHVRNDRKWSEKNVLDQGFRYKDGEDRHDIVDSLTNKTVTAPVLLDGAGGILADPSTATAVYLPFVEFEEADLSIVPGIT